MNIIYYNWKILLNFLTSLGILISLHSCSTGISLDIDRDKWMADFDGCSGYRLYVYESIIQEKEKLLGLSTMKIMDLLGNPNKNELYKRNQKFFVYQISPGPSCEKPKIGEDENLFLIFRFNAMDLANEIYLNDAASPTD